LLQIYNLNFIKYYEVNKDIFFIFGDKEPKSFAMYFNTLQIPKEMKKLRGRSPQANYIDQATAACRRS
jgi:hypothetical protein